MTKLACPKVKSSVETASGAMPTLSGLETRTAFRYPVTGFVTLIVGSLKKLFIFCQYLNEKE